MDILCGGTSNLPGMDLLIMVCLVLVALSGVVFCFDIALRGWGDATENYVTQGILFFGLMLGNPFTVVLMFFALCATVAALCIGAVGLTLVGTFKAALWGYAKLREAL